MELLQDIYNLNKYKLQKQKDKSAKDKTIYGQKKIKWSDQILSGQKKKLRKKYNDLFSDVTVFA